MFDITSSTEVYETFATAYPRVQGWADQIKAGIAPAFQELAGQYSVDAIRSADGTQMADLFIQKWQEQCPVVIDTEGEMRRAMTPAVVAVRDAYLASLDEIATPWTVKVGDLLRIDTELRRGAYFQNDAIVRVTEVEDGDMFRAEYVEGPGSPQSQVLYKALVGRHHLVLDAEATVLPYPEAPHDLAKYHEAALDRLRVWAENGVDDVKGGVDAQAVALATYSGDDGDVWPSDSCATTGTGKDFLGAVMRYKKALLSVEVSQPTVEGDTEPDVPVEVDPKDEQIALLQERVNRAEELARRRWDNHTADITLIGSRLLEEAESRSWCSEYDQIISDLNSRLNVPIDEREKEYGVWVTETVEVEVRRFVTGEFTSAEDAEEYAAESEVEVSEIIEAIRSGQYEVTNTETGDAEEQ